MGRFERLFKHRSFAHWSFPEERPPVARYIGFTIASSSAAYIAAMLVDAERERRRKQSSRVSRWFSPDTMSRNEQWYDDRSIFSSVKSYWKSRKESEKTILALLGANTVVFFAWRLPNLTSIMTRYFLHSTRANPITILTSVFSHQAPMHFIFNMAALYSFGPFVHERLGREQFLAFYLSSGMAASLGSHLIRVYRRDAVRSLGASGALFGIVGAAAHFPDLKVSLIFLPFHSVPITTALPVIMAVDILGILKRWSSFDHAAHLSGAVFGYVWYRISTERIWRNRTRLLSSLGYHR